MFCFFKQKTAYEMRISDWSSDVGSSDLLRRIKVFGRSDTASMHRDRTIAETFQQRIDRLCVRRVGRDIINAEIDECGRKDEQECCQHTDERPTRPVSPKRFLVHSHLLAISCETRIGSCRERVCQT